MRLVLKSLLLLLVMFGGAIGFAVWKPVTASRLIYPTIEAFMLREPFVGVTSDGTPRPGLFALTSTGVTTRPVVDAARAFIATLSDAQRQRMMFPVDDLEWRQWANIHISHRQGVGFLELDEAQTGAAFDLLTASLSARGLQTSRDIMRLEGYLADLMDDHVQYGQQRYWFTIMGEPSAAAPWGWQLDGHHLVINYFVLGDQVVMTPTFMGSELPRAETGRYAGVSILDEELAAGLAMINSLDPAQQRIAIIAESKPSNNNHGELFQDNAIVPYQGIALAVLTREQQERARGLIALYIGNLPAEHAAVRMQEIEDHWIETHFAWVGDTGPDAVFYYRIHSPVVLIEYDHQNPVALDGPDVPSRNHVHTVVRTPNGNDYGKDLLAQHLRSEHR